MKSTAKTADRPGQAAGNAVSGRGKKLILALFTVCLFGSSPAFAKDPCKAVMCMFGKLKGESGGSECRSAEREYFSILVKKHGNIKWSKTASARQDYLDSCPEAQDKFTKKINDKFGKLRG